MPTVPASAGEGIPDVTRVVDVPCGHVPMGTEVTAHHGAFCSHLLSRERREERDLWPFKVNKSLKM